MKTFQALKTLRISAAVPAVVGLMMIGATTAAHADSVDQADIIDGFIDVDENGVVDTLDDLTNVRLLCNGAQVRVDIIDGGVDVNEGGAVLTSDDLTNCIMTTEPAGFPVADQVDIIDGGVDVTEGSVVNTADDATNVQLFRIK